MKNLFDVTYINGLKLKNRFVRSATWENMVNANGSLPDRLLSIYDLLAKGGIGLIITGTAYVTKSSHTLSGHMHLNNEKVLGEYESLVKCAHKQDAKIIMQMNYAGKNEEMPSPHELSKTEIEDIIAGFGNTAARAQRLGFDGIQIHAAHGFFLSRFLSLKANIRADEYGGSLEKNLKIILDILKEVQNKTDRNFPVLIKLDCIDPITLKEAFDTCLYNSTQLSKKGISAIEISGNVFSRLPANISKYKESIFRDCASSVAESLNVPVILVGFNRTPSLMTEILNSTKVGYFSISRPLIRDPNLINKWYNDISYKTECASCNRCFTRTGNQCPFVTSSQE